MDEPERDDSDDTILKDSREGLKTCIEDEQELRDKMLDDLKFATLDQWPADVRSLRENDRVNGARPCLTVDQINQYRTQVANDMAANRPSIKIRPVDDFADPDTAKIIQGLVRHIEDRSSAHIAYQTAGDSAVTIGLGFFRIVSDYISPDSDKQELFIRRIPDTFSVYLGAHLMPDGSDADAGWIFEKMPLDKFKREYPKAKIKDEDFTGLGVTPTWKSGDSVLVCEYFYKNYESKELLFLSDGNTAFRDDYERLSEDGRPEITGSRKSQKITIKWVKHTGCEILDKREIKGQYIPIIEEVGKENIVEGKRILWGLVRPAKDSLRAYNYWISAMVEKMALAPKAPFVGAVGQFASQGDKWDKANVNNYSKLEYDPIEVSGNVVPAPRRQEPAQMEAGMMQVLGIMQNNVKSSLGMYKASVGDTESQQSGRAILALKRESDTGTSHFGENQAISIAHCGRILVDLIPYYYDTKRILRIIGEDGSAATAAIDPDQPEAKREIQDAVGKIKRIYNLNVGRYDVTVTVGPGYTTSRQEAATVMTELANSAKDPVSAAIMRYGAVKNSDFHGAEEILKMLKATLPPNVLPQDGQEPIPAAAMQKIQQMGQQMQMMGQAGEKLAQENQQLKAGVQADMAKVNADHEAKMAALALQKQEQDEEARLARERFEFERDLEIDKANHELKIERDKNKSEQDMQMEKHQFDMRCKMAENPQATEMTIMPDMVQTLEKLAGTFANIDAILQQQTEIQAKTLVTQEQILQHQISPKVVSIGGVRKDASGRVIGATIGTTLQ